MKPLKIDHIGFFRKFHTVQDKPFLTLTNAQGRHLAIKYQRHNCHNLTEYLKQVKALLLSKSENPEEAM